MICLKLNRILKLYSMNFARSTELSPYIFEKNLSGFKMKFFYFYKKTPFEINEKGMDPKR